MRSRAAFCVLCTPLEHCFGVNRLRKSSPGGCYLDYSTSMRYSYLNGPLYWRPRWYWYVILRRFTCASCVTRKCACAGLVDAVNASRGGGIRTGGDADAEGVHHARGGLHEAARSARRGPHARRHRQIALRGVLFITYMGLVSLHFRVVVLPYS